jgi:hypothetical protein
MKKGTVVTDMKYWFAKVYHFVTLNELQAIDAGTYDYPLMKMQEVIGFEATYQHNLDAWREGRKADVESNWKAAFSSAEHARDTSFTDVLQDLATNGLLSRKSQEVLRAMLPSMEAHIRFDLPRAIAAAFEEHYQGITGLNLSDFRADFNKMGPVFEKAQNDLNPEIDAYSNQDIRPDPGSWHWLQGVGFPFIFNIPLERQQAWEKTGAIVSGHERGITSQPGMERRLESYIHGAHPGSGVDAFTVAGTDVTDYNWNQQPPPK